MKINNKLFRAGLGVMILTFLAKGMGFIRETAMAYHYGTSEIADAYYVAIGVGDTLFSGLTGALVVVYVPICAAVEMTQELKLNVTNALISMTTIIVFPLTVIAAGISKLLVPFFAVGFDQNTLQYASEMIRIAIIFYICFSLTDLLIAFLRINGVYIINGIIHIAISVTTIIGISISNGNEKKLILGYAIGLALGMAISLLAATKKGYHYHPSFKLPKGLWKKIIKLSIPVYIGNFIYQLQIVVDRNMGSLFGTGVISGISYSNKINVLFIELIIFPITTVMVPSMAKLASDIHFHNDFRILVKKINNGAFLCMAIIGVIISALSQTIIDIVFARGAFSSTSCKITSDLLKVYAIGIPFISINQLLNNEFYSLKKTKVPVRCNIISLLLNIGLNFILIHICGYVGIAWATTISVIIQTILLELAKKKNFP